MNDFENKFNNMEQDMEIRIQSLYLEIDNLEQNAISEINTNEKRILANEKVELKFFFKRLNFKRGKIGTFYTELDQISDFNICFNKID